MKIASNDPNLVHLANEKILNFASYLGRDTTAIFTKKNLDEFLSSNTKEYRENQLEIFTKMKPFAVSMFNVYYTEGFILASKALIEPFIKSDYITSQNALSTIDPFTSNDCEISLGKFREQLKKVFNLHNIIVAYNTENKNLFDICIDGIGDPEDISVYNPLEYTFKDNIIHFSHPEKLVITIFVSPKKLKELLSIYLAQNRKNFEKNSYNFHESVMNVLQWNTTIHKPLYELFVVSLITSLVVDQHREKMISQIKLVMNMVKFADANQITDAFVTSASTYIISAKEKFAALLQDKFYELLLQHEMIGNTRFKNSPKSIGYYYCHDSVLFNPLLATQLMGELSDTEINEFLTRLQLKNSSKNHVRISSLITKTNNPLTIEAIRQTIALHRITPLMYYITYIINNGIQFKITETLFKEINTFLEFAYTVSLRNSSFGALTTFIHSFSRYNEVFGSFFQNPLHTQRNFIHFILKVAHDDKRVIINPEGVTN